MKLAASATKHGDRVRFVGREVFCKTEVSVDDQHPAALEAADIIDMTELREAQAAEDATARLQAAADATARLHDVVLAQKPIRPRKRFAEVASS